MKRRNKMAKNKVKFNLKNVHAAKLTQDGAGGYTYATPQAIPGAVSLSLNAEGDENKMFADGIVYYRSVANNGYSGDLEIALIPEWFRTEILKEVKDDNGVLVETNDDPTPVYFALLFEVDGDAHGVRRVFYNCSVSQRPTIESETKQETVEPGTETLSITADPRDDGLVKCSTGDETDTATYNNWYKSVYVPSITDDDTAAG